MGIECDRCHASCKHGDYIEMRGEDEIWCDDCHKDIDKWRKRLMELGCEDLRIDHVCECQTGPCPHCRETLPQCIFLTHIGLKLCPPCMHKWELEQAKTKCGEDDCFYCLLDEHRKTIDGYLFNCFEERH